MKISWDEIKRAKNLRKHGIDFRVAQYVFSDPLHLSEQDRIQGHEYRWQTLGLVEGALLMVGHNYRDDGVEEEIRIITARRATAKERKQYHES